MDDLWATLNHNGLKISTEQGRLTRMRRFSEGQVMSSLREWLLQDYATAYCRSLAETRIFRRCYWVDALGGVGKGTSGSQDNTEARPETEPVGRKGRTRTALQPVHPMLQPVVALSQALAQESRPIALHGLVLTAGSSKRKEGRAQQNGHGPAVIPKESGLVQASWLETAPAILNTLEQAPAIFLLNPFGARTFTYEDLAPLYQRTVPTEMCLLVPHKQIETLLQKAQRSAVEAGLLTGLLRSDRWKGLPGEKEQREQAVAGCIELVKQSMQRHFLFPVQGIPLLALAGPAVVEHLPYTLIFATRRQDSLLCMNDALCCYQRRLRSESWQGVLGESWFADQEQGRLQAARQELAQRLVQQGRALRIRRWPDLRQQLVSSSFGQFTRLEYDVLLEQLLLKGEVRCEWRRRGMEEQQVPGNDDTLIWR